MLDKSDRLRPVVIPTRRGPEQLIQILESLARAELTDGLDFPQLVSETISRMPRDATVIAILPQATPASVFSQRGHAPFASSAVSPRCSDLPQKHFVDKSLSHFTSGDAR